MQIVEKALRAKRDEAREHVLVVKSRDLIARTCSLACTPPFCNSSTCFRIPGSGFIQGYGFRVQGSGFRISGSGFRVSGSGFRVQGYGFRVQGSRFRVSGSGFRVSDFGFRVSGFGVRVQGFGFRVLGSGFRASIFEFSVQSFGFRVQGPGFRRQGQGFSKYHDGKAANGSKNRPHDAYPARCRVLGYYAPCSERVCGCQLKK